MCLDTALKYNAEHCPYCTQEPFDVLLKKWMTDVAYAQRFEDVVQRYRKAGKSLTLLHNFSGRGLARGSTASMTRPDWTAILWRHAAEWEASIEGEVGTSVEEQARLIEELQDRFRRQEGELSVRAREERMRRIELDAEVANARTLRARGFPFGPLGVFEYGWLAIYACAILLVWVMLDRKKSQVAKSCTG